MAQISNFVKQKLDSYSDACWFVRPRPVPGVMAALDAAIHANIVASF